MSAGLGMQSRAPDRQDFAVDLRCSFQSCAPDTPSLHFSFHRKPPNPAVCQTVTAWPRRIPYTVLLSISAPGSTWKHSLPGAKHKCKTGEKSQKAEKNGSLKSRLEKSSAIRSSVLYSTSFSFLTKLERERSKSNQT